MATTEDVDTDSPVVQVNKGHAQDLGRGACVKSLLCIVILKWQSLPAGVTDAGPVVGSKVGKSGDLGSVSGGVLDSGQQHTDTGTEVSGLTKTQKLKLRNRQKCKTSNVTVGGSGVGTKRPRSDG